MKQLVVLVALALVTDASAAPPGAMAVIDRPVAIVGDESVWESQVDRLMHGRDAKDRPGVIEGLIEERLWVHEGRRRGVTVDRAETLSALDEIKQQNKLDDAGLDKALAEQGYTRADYIGALEEQLLLLRTKNVVISAAVIVTDAEVEAEGKRRNLKVPLGEPDRTDVWRDLRRARSAELETKWITVHKARVRIERRP